MAGDFCPSMRLASTDVLCARLSPHDGLLRKIANPPEGAPKVRADRVTPRSLAAALRTRCLLA